MDNIQEGLQKLVSQTVGEEVGKIKGLIEKELAGMREKFEDGLRLIKRIEELLQLQPAQPLFTESDPIVKLFPGKGIEQRIRNVLGRLGIKTVGDLSKIMEESKQLRKSKHLGDKSMKLIEDRLKKLR